MKILIINPNSDPKMTSVILSAAESFAGDRFEVVCKSTPGAPAFIDSYMTYREDDLMIEIAQLEDGAKLGAETALAYNQGVTNWQVSPGAVMLEEMCCQALCRFFDLPQSADATFMYSGTYANQQAIYLALHQKAEQNGFDFAEKGLLGFENPDQLVLVASEEAHFSLRQTLRMMGLGEKSLIGVKADENRRMDVDDLKKYLYERVINERERLSMLDFKIIH